MPKTSMELAGEVQRHLDIWKPRPVYRGTGGVIPGTLQSSVAKRMEPLSQQHDLNALWARLLRDVIAVPYHTLSVDALTNISGFPLRLKQRICCKDGLPEFMQLTTWKEMGLSLRVVEGGTAKGFAHCTLEIDIADATCPAAQLLRDSVINNLGMLEYIAERDILRTQAAAKVAKFLTANRELFVQAGLVACTGPLFLKEEEAALAASERTILELPNISTADSLTAFSNTLPRSVPYMDFAQE